MKRTCAILVFINALSSPLLSPAEAAEDMFSLMFRMMLTAMNVMSDTMDDDSGNMGNWGMNDWDFGGGMGMGSLPMMSGIPGTGMSPWSGFGGFPMNSFGMSPWSMPMTGTPWGSGWGSSLPGGVSPSMIPGYLNNFNQAFPSMDRGYPYNPWQQGPTGNYPPQYRTVSILEGKWYGSSGEILEIRGKRFRLQAGRTAITGTIKIENNIVSLFSPQTGTVTQYTFIRNQTNLLLQDASGQVLDYQQRPTAGTVRVF
jgi:hypothetical protein